MLVSPDGIDGSGYMYFGSNRCINFDKDIWFELGKSIRKRHRRVFQDHIKNIHNDIVKPFMVIILKYDKRIREMNDLVNYFPPPPMKGRWFKSYYWAVRNK